MNLTPGQKRALTLRKREPDFYKRIGSLGGKSRQNPYSHFSELKKSDPAELSRIGSIGGKKSKRS